MVERSVVIFFATRVAMRGTRASRRCWTRIAGLDTHLVKDFLPLHCDVSSVRLRYPIAPARIDDAVADVADGRAGGGEQRREVIEEELAERLNLAGAWGYGEGGEARGVSGSIEDGIARD